MEAERALADALLDVSRRHASEPDIRETTRLLAGWSRDHARALATDRERLGRPSSRRGWQLRRALFEGHGTGRRGAAPRPPRADELRGVRRGLLDDRAPGRARLARSGPGTHRPRVRGRDAASACLARHEAQPARAAGARGPGAAAGAVGLAAGGPVDDLRAGPAEESRWPSASSRGSAGPWRHGGEGAAPSTASAILAGLSLGWTGTVRHPGSRRPSERAASRPRPAPGPARAHSHGPSPRRMSQGRGDKRRPRIHEGREDHEDAPETGSNRGQAAVARIIPASIVEHQHRKLAAPG